MTHIAPAIPELAALFPPQTAGYGMITKVPIVLNDLRVKDVQAHIVKNAKAYESLNYVYVVNDAGKLLGVVSIRELLQARWNVSISAIMVRNMVTANPMTTVHQVALLSLRHHLKMIPIVDHKNRLLGAYSSDQLLEVLNKDFSNDLLRLSGVRIPFKHFHFESLRVFWTRLPWMIVGMIGGLATGAIIGAYQSSIQAVVLLAVFIPVIMSSGATSANQSAMIFIRNLTYGDIKDWGRYMLNELKVAALLGGGLAVLIFLIIWLFLGYIALALAVALSLWLTVIAGALVGVATPMAINAFKLDPSIGAGPFLTIIKDLIAMSIYFSVATALLRFFS